MPFNQRVRSYEHIARAIISQLEKMGDLSEPDAEVCRREFYNEEYMLKPTQD